MLCPSKTHFFYENTNIAYIKQSFFQEQSISLGVGCGGVRWGGVVWHDVWAGVG